VSNAAPIDGRATLATAKFRLATAATRISAARTLRSCSGPTEDPGGAPTVCVPVRVAHHWLLTITTLGTYAPPKVSVLSQTPPG
jgi:hypothetical protein